MVLCTLVHFGSACGVGRSDIALPGTKQGGKVILNGVVAQLTLDLRNGGRTAVSSRVICFRPCSAVGFWKAGSKGELNGGSQQHYKTVHPGSVLSGTDVGEEKAARLRAHLLQAVTSCDIRAEICGRLQGTPQSGVCGATH